jgi:hypothetical protein
MITMVLLLTLHLMGGGNPAVAFTVRFGPIPVSDASVVEDSTVNTDLPTPQMLNLRVGAHGVTFGPLQATPKVAPAEPTVRGPSRVKPHAADEPPAPLARHLTSPRQLSGVEIMLLRHATQVANAQ